MIIIIIIMMMYKALHPGDNRDYKCQEKKEEDLPVLKIA